MALKQIWVSNYRSLRKVRLNLDRINVVVGSNGVGKSNLHRAVTLLARAARGRLGVSLIQEGGMPSVLWAGRREKGPVRLVLGVETDEWSYELKLGLPRPDDLPGGTLFDLDPDVKEEHVWIGSARKASTAFVERRRGDIFVRNEQGRMMRYALSPTRSESVLYQIQDPTLCPELYILKNNFAAWRFYHHFRTDEESPLRRPELGTRTEVLGEDGSGLVACLQTLRELGRPVDAAIEAAFPNSHLHIHSASKERPPSAHMSLSLSFALRQFAAHELSDGTLRYLCLVAALLSSDPPEMLILNEPDNSLHPDLLAPLAELIVKASDTTQLWITTHSPQLAELLEQSPRTRVFRLYMDEGETLVEGQSLLDLY